jgi:hypothetical protein
MDTLRNKFSYFQESAAEFATTGGETEDRHYEDEQVGDVNDEVGTEGMTENILQPCYLVV